MRLVNFLLHLIVVSVMFSAMNIEAQQNLNLPTLVQGLGDQTLTANNPGDLVVGCVVWETPNACPQSATFTETSAHLSALTFGNAECINNGTSNITFDANLVMEQFYATVSSAGTLSFSAATPPFPRLVYSSMEEISQGSNLTLDVQNQSGSVAATNPSISVTTTKHNDVIASCMSEGFDANSGGNVSADPVLNGQQYAAATPQVFSDLGSLASWQRAGLAGAQTQNWTGTIVNGGGSPPCCAGVGLSTLAFKATNVTVGTSKMPDALTTSAYYAKLVAYGGSGTYTWSIPVGALPTGLSLNTSTGEITGTASSAGTTSFTARVTESGGSTHGDQALTIKAGSAVGAITLRSSCTFGGVSVGPCGPFAQTGDVVHILYFGDDTHTNMGFTIPASNITDQCGDVFVRAEQTTGEQRAGIADYVTVATCTGTMTISYNGLIGDPLTGIVVAYGGGQTYMDYDVTNSDSPGNVGSDSLTTSFTAQVPNMQLLSLSCLNCQGGGCTTGTNAPFNLVATNGGTGATCSLYDQAATTATSYSATTTFANTSLQFAPVMTALIGIRPAISSGTLPQGEKIRGYRN